MIRKIGSEQLYQPTALLWGSGTQPEMDYLFNLKLLRGSHPFVLLYRKADCHEDNNDHKIRFEFEK